MFNVIMFGPPGSGKGTQSIMVAEKYGLSHISTGDLLRSEVKNGTELGLRVKSILESGELVPDELLIDIFKSAMEKHAGTKGFVFDGFPRTIPQVHDLDQAMAEAKSSISLVICLDVDDEEIISRLLKRAEIQGRKDDTEEVIRNRLSVYQEQTAPLIDFYKEQQKYVCVDGVGSIDDIFSLICGAINRLI